MLHSTYLGSGKSGNPLYHSFPMSVPYEALWQVYICFLWCQLFGLIKTCFLHSVLAVTCFCSFHKKARLLVFSSGRCTAITALLWRSAGHAACCTHTKGTFPLSYFSSHQHGDEDTTITGIVLQHAASLHIHYRTTSQFGFQNLQWANNKCVALIKESEGNTTEKKKWVLLNAFVLLKSTCSFHVCILCRITYTLTAFPPTLFISLWSTIFQAELHPCTARWTYHHCSL